MRAQTLFCMSTICLMLAQNVSGQQNIPVHPTQDVALTNGNFLVGKLCKADGTPLAAEPIAIKTANGKAKSWTDKNGQFVIGNVPSGTQQLETSFAVYPIRTWGAASAPPHASQTFNNLGCTPLMAAGYTRANCPTEPAMPLRTIRGQNCDGRGDGRGGGMALGPVAKVAGVGLAVGLGVWGIVELADDDPPAS